MEERFKEAHGVGIGLEELEDTDSSRRIVSRQKGPTSSNDEKGFVVKAPVTESKYRVRRAATAEENLPAGLTLAAEDVFEDSKEDVQEELAEKIIEVAREHDVEEGEDEVDSPIIKKEVPRDVAQDRAVLASPAHLYAAVKAVDSELPALKSESGVDQTESNTRRFVRGNYSGEEGDSDADEEYDETDEDDEEDGGGRGGRAQLGRSGEFSTFDVKVLTLHTI